MYSNEKEAGPAEDSGIPRIRGETIGRTKKEQFRFDFHDHMVRLFGKNSTNDSRFEGGGTGGGTGGI